MAISMISSFSHLMSCRALYDGFHGAQRHSYSFLYLLMTLFVGIVLLPARQAVSQSTAKFGDCILCTRLYGWQGHGLLLPSGISWCEFICSHLMAISRSNRNFAVQPTSKSAFRSGSAENSHSAVTLFKLIAGQHFWDTGCPGKLAPDRLWSGIIDSVLLLTPLCRAAAVLTRCRGASPLLLCSGFLGPQAGMPC